MPQALQLPLLEPRRGHRAVRLLRAARTRIDAARGVLGESVDTGGCRERSARSARRGRSGLAPGLAGSAGGAGPDEGAGNKGRCALRCAVGRKIVAATARKHTWCTGNDGRGWQSDLSTFHHALTSNSIALPSFLNVAFLGPAEEPMKYNRIER